MRKKDEITSAKVVELEMWLIEHQPIMNEEELLKLGSNGFSQSEIEYLVNAYNLPMAEIKEQITIYDTTRSNADELRFISELSRRFNVDSNLIIKRIQEVRSINKYLTQHPDIDFPDCRIFNKLVRDKIPDIIENNGEKAIYHVLSNEEYWEYLLKKDSEELEEVRLAQTREEIKEELCDKLELIRAMASHSGFTLDDIIEESNRKNEKKGAFTRKIFLERTYKKKK